MNKTVLLKEITGVYLKHGWTLRRLLLTPEMRGAAAAQIEKLATGDVSITENDFDAVWFSRVGGVKRESWELRLVQTAPYALFEMFDTDLPVDARETQLRKIEDKMRQHAAKRTV